MSVKKIFLKLVFLTLMITPSVCAHNNTEARYLCLATRGAKVNLAPQAQMRFNPGHSLIILTSRNLESLRIIDSHANREQYDYHGEDARTRLIEYLQTETKAAFSTFCSKLESSHIKKIENIMDTAMLDASTPLAEITHPDNYRFFANNCTTFALDFYNQVFGSNENIRLKIIGKEFKVDAPSVMLRKLQNLELKRQRQISAITFRHKGKGFRLSHPQMIREFNSSPATRNGLYDFALGIER